VTVLMLSPLRVASASRQRRAHNSPAHCRGTPLMGGPDLREGRDAPPVRTARLVLAGVPVQGVQAYLSVQRRHRAIEAVVRDVAGLRAGDEVFGEGRGTFAEYACAPADKVERRSGNVSFTEAAAIPLAGNTALMGLRDAARLRAGQGILINGACGGVGTFAVQLATGYGVRVTAVCGTRSADLVGKLGADHVIDYTQGRLRPRCGPVRRGIRPRRQPLAGACRG
jgi:Zinc-binding dehydrogenase